MKIYQKLWYVVVSLVYILFVAGLGAYAVSDLFDFFTSFILIALLVGAFQYIRVLWSQRRREAREPLQVVASFWSVHTDFALLCVLGLLCLQMIAGLVHFLVAR